MAPKDANAANFSTIAKDALIEMGPILAKVTTAIKDHLRPQHLYVGCYGYIRDCNRRYLRPDYRE